MTIDDACNLVKQFGAEKGWTDTEQYIREHKVFLLMGRWFIVRNTGEVESLE